MVDTDRIAGTAKELGGKVQGAAGDFVGSSRDSVEGRFREAQGEAQDAYGQAKDTLRNVADDAADYAGDAYDRGSAYLRDGSRVVGSRVEENPLVALLIAGAVGYGLALLLHGRREAPAGPRPPAVAAGGRASSLRGPAAIDREVGARHLGRGGGAQEHRDRRHLIDRDEFLGRLRLEEHVLDHLLLGEPARLHGVGDLALDERRPDVARRDAVRRDAVGGEFEGHRLRKPAMPCLAAT